MRDNIVVADILRACRHVDSSLGLNYTHPTRATSLVRHVATAADAVHCGEAYSNFRDYKLIINN